jgi:hypothetical protein
VIVIVACAYVASGLSKKIKVAEAAMSRRMT